MSTKLKRATFIFPTLVAFALAFPELASATAISSNTAFATSSDPLMSGFSVDNALLGSFNGLEGINASVDIYGRVVHRPQHPFTDIQLTPGLGVVGAPAHTPLPDSDYTLMLLSVAIPLLFLRRRELATL